MNVQIIYDGQDITSKVVSYTREQQICSGVGNAIFEMDFSISPQLYKNIVLYEGGIKKGTYIIVSVDKNVNEGTTTATCQDNSKKLQDYFIAESYEVTEPTYCRYWIEKFLDEATVSYNFNVSDQGSLVSNNTNFGLTDAMSTITTLLQMSGWYLYFDANGVAQIGHFNFDVDQADHFLTEEKILSLKYLNHDKSFRNRVVVYGSGNPINQSWVSAEIDRTGVYPNERGSGDTRSVVIANSSIPDNTAAMEIATKAITEMTRENREITVDLAGYFGIQLGDAVFIRYKDMSFYGTVTTVGSKLDRSGLITHVVIGEFCPRLFTYFDYGGSVYVGTEGSGIWRKHIRWDHTWTNFSTGLQDLDIVDLYIYGGMMVCVTKSGYLYTRTVYDSSWVREYATVFDPELNTEVSTEDLLFKACTINAGDSSIYAVATNKIYVLGNENYPPRSYLFKKSGDQISMTPLIFSTGYILATDIDNNRMDEYITAIVDTNIPVPNSDVSYLGPNLLTTTEYQTLWYINQSSILVDESNPYNQEYVFNSSYGEYVFGFFRSGSDYYAIRIYLPNTSSSIVFGYSSSGIALSRCYSIAVSPVEAVYMFLENIGWTYIVRIFYINYSSQTYYEFPYFNQSSLYYWYTYNQNNRTMLFLSDYGYYRFMNMQDRSYSTQYRISIPVLSGNTYYSTHIDIVARLDTTLYGIGTQQERLPDNSTIERQFSFSLSEAGYTYNILNDGSYNNRIIINSISAGIDLQTGYVLMSAQIGNNTSKSLCGLNISNLNFSHLAFIPQLAQYQSIGFAFSQNQLYFTIFESTVLGDTYRINFYDPYTMQSITSYAGSNLNIGQSVDYYSKECLITDNNTVIYAYNPSNNNQKVVYSGTSVGIAYFIGSKLAFRNRIIYPVVNYSAIFPALFKYTSEDSSLDLITILELPSKIEISNVYPYVVYGSVASGGGLLYHSWLGEEGTFEYNIPGFSGDYPVLDVRSMREISPSGLVTKTLFSNPAPSGVSSLNVIEKDENNSLYVNSYTQFNGVVQYIETTNTEEYPFIFVSVSGDRYRFYQRDGSYNYNGTANGFVDRTNNLPDSKITVIRCDDIL